ncbi:putative transcriptional regulator [Bradyrhizobium sp. AZCC 2230]
MTRRADSGEALENLSTKLAALDAAIARGFDDAETGRVKPSSEVFDRLEARLASKADRRDPSKSPKD